MDGRVSTDSGLDSARRKKKKKRRARALEPQITVFVHINECSFPVCCGKGDQSIRWLALCAARRYASEFPSGRIRQREIYHSGLRPILPPKVKGHTRGRRPKSAGPGDHDGNSLPWNAKAHKDQHRHPRQCMGRVPYHSIYEKGKTLRRLSQVGGLLQRGNLSPIRLKFPAKKQEKSVALAHTYDRHDHVPPPSSELVNMDNDLVKAFAHTAPAGSRFKTPTRRTRFSRSTLRPKSTEGQKRSSRRVGAHPYGGTKRPSTAGPNLSKRKAEKPKEYSSVHFDPEDTFKSVYFTPFDTIKDTLKAGDHVWIKLDMRGGALVDRIASLGEWIHASEEQNTLLVDGWEDSFVLSGFVQGRFMTKEKIIQRAKIKSAKSAKLQKAVKKKKKRIMFGGRRGGNIQATVELLLSNDLERSKVDAVLKNCPPSTVQKVRKLLSENYLRLENLFRHFAFLLPGNSFTMGASEFLMLCKACNVTCKKCDQSTQGRLFIAANVTKRVGKDGKQQLGKAEDDGGKNEAVMYEFLEAVVRLGLVRYKGEFDDDPYEQLKHFIGTNLGPVADRIMEEWNRPLKYLNTEEVQSCLLKDGRLEFLKQSYFAFAMYNRHDGPSRSDGAQRAIPPNRRGPRAQMSMDDWIQFMQESNFIDNENITLQKGQESFVAAQMHSRIHQKVSKKKKAIKADEGAFALMDFGEYLEAFAQIAYRKYPEDTISFAEKMENLILLTKAYFEGKMKSNWIAKTKALMPKVDFGLDEFEEEEEIDYASLDSEAMGGEEDLDHVMGAIGF